MIENHGEKCGFRFTPLIRFKNEERKGFLTMQTVDLITVEEDETRTCVDRKNKEKLTAKARDGLINTEFYSLKFF